MLQYPTNVYPDGSTFDSSVSDANSKISFTFNGDFCSGCLYKMYNYDTGEQITLTTPVIGYQDHHAIGYNGDTISTSGNPFSTLSAGNYAMQLQLFQYDASGTNPLYDMFVLRGITQENYLTTDEYIVIEDKISNIYEWDTTPNATVRHPSYIWGALAGSMIMQIGTQRIPITEYEPSTGKTKLSSAFSANIPAGTKYQIYSNYKVSPPYYFKVRTNPTISLTLSISNVNPTLHHHVVGTYSQSQMSLINYYTIALYWSDTDNSSTPWRKVDETPKIYSQQISYDFWDDLILRYEYAGAASTYALYYKAVITVATVDGKTFTQDSNIVDAGGVTADVPTTTTSLIVQDLDRADVAWESDWVKQCIDISYSQGEGLFPVGTRILCYREDLQNNETVRLDGLYDVTVPTKGKFRYYIVPRSSQGNAYLKGISWADITVDMRGCTITELKLMPENYQWGTRLRYRIGDSWKFIGEVQNTTVTQNTDRAIHVGYGTYPNLTLTKTNYMTGSVSAMLGYVDCVTSYGTRKYEDNIDLVKAWRDFITRPSIYMLKSQKGDVWIVNITDNITTTYDETNKIMPTTITFNWVECCSVNDLIIIYDPHITD